MVRLVLYILLGYLLYKLFHSLFGGDGEKRRKVKGEPPRVSPPPYDPSQVEDIEYKEVKGDE